MSTGSDGPRPARTLILAVGNPLMGDDGLGPAVLAQLLEQWILPPEVSWLDGGTAGLQLLPQIEDAERVLFVDAIDVGAPPGSAVLLERGELPRHCGLRVSPHEVGLRDLLALAELRGNLPRDALAIGLQPDAITALPALSVTVSARLPDVVARIVERLAAWGHELQPARVRP